VRILLDTHLLLWALSRPSKLSSGGRNLIEDGEIYVSAASIWEISIKQALGKLEADPREVAAAVEPAGFFHLPITSAHAVKISELPSVHKDPFDRILVAQALLEPMILLTNDEILRGYGTFVELI
jgi:PIN domain nuclease of toxin-antitoxin system